MTAKTPKTRIATINAEAAVDIAERFVSICPTFFFGFSKYFLVLRMHLG
jgi:protein involved in ribonucleotide reduction